MKTCSSCEKSVEQGIEALDLSFCDYDCLTSFVEWTTVDLRASFVPSLDATAELL